MIAIGFLLALGGCNSDGLIRRSEAEDIAEDFADAAASRQVKRNRAHIVPLSDAALAVLAKADAMRLEGAEVVFPA
jgi:hypothetical protein